MRVRGLIDKDLEELDSIGLKLEKAKRALQELKEKITKANAERIERILNTRQSLSDFRELFDVKYLDVIVKCSAVSPVQWLPQEANSQLFFDVHYVAGKTPWSFYLALKDSVQRNRILASLKHQNNENQLRNVKSPMRGSVLCCKTLFGPPFRGIVLSVTETLLNVMDIDSGKQFDVPVSNAFELNQEAASINAQVIHCALYPEDEVLLSKWSEALSQTFEQNLSRADTLRVMILHEATHEYTCPPKFIVKIQDFSPSSDFSDFLAWLEKLVESGLDISEKTDNNLNENSYHDNDDEIDSLVLPFSITQKLQILDDDDEEEESTLCHKWSNGPYDQNISSVPLPNGRSFEEDRISETSTVMDVTAAEFIPRQRVALEPEPLYSSLQKQNVCKFYLLNEYCWKKGCSQAHIKKHDFETQKSVYTTGSANLIDLPLIREKVKVTVTQIISAHEFYVQLPPKFSDIGEVDALETFESLMDDINHPDVRNTLEALPAGQYPMLGEVVLGHGRYNRWARVRVTDCHDEDAEVFYVDYGTTDVLKHDKLRMMKPEFEHLPYQAVRMRLNGVYSVKDLDDKDRKFLEKTLLNQEVDAVIKDRRLIDSEIEADVYLKNSCFLNRLCVDKGYCAEYVSN